MSSDKIIVRGASEHNLKNIDVDIPRNKMVVITGLSGSGKSSLAFDTIYAEGQRKYVESLSAYARQFLEQMEKPNVESIDGLSPAIAIEQRTASSNPRSTVGTVTEIYDYLRLLFARIGKPHCYRCGRVIQSQTITEIVDKVLSMPNGTKIQILAPLVRGRKGEYKKLLEEISRQGFVRVRIDKKIYELPVTLNLNKKIKHDIEVVVDRLIIDPKIKKRLTNSLETALKLANGIVVINEMIFSRQYACVKCDISYEELTPRMFSFNSPYGACKVCSGLGTRVEVDETLVVPDNSFSIRGGAIQAWRRSGHHVVMYYNYLLRGLSHHYNFSLETPFKSLNKKIRNIILYGTGADDKYEFEGVIPNLERRFKETKSEYVKAEILKYMGVRPCPSCEGKRLKSESLSVLVNAKNIAEITALSVKAALKFFENLPLNENDLIISRDIVKEIKARLDFMVNVGLDYLTIDRISSTLSGGEAERIRLATQIGSGLVGVLYVLDEPSIGLHQRDNIRLLETLKKLRDLGNTLLVVEHDEAAIRAADYILDLGPGAGKEGGEVVACGTLEDILKEERSLTGQYLKGKLKIDVPEIRRKAKTKSLIIKAASEHNLKNIDVEIPLGVFVCVTGVSGSGKSTLIHEVLYKSLARTFYRSRERPGAHKKILGVKNIDKVVLIDQAPIGRTPRSNPATYTGVFTYIRELFSMVQEAKIRGYKPGRFSFNVDGGRCEACKGDGIIRIEMHFLPDVYVHCQVCKAKRYNRQTLEVRYKGRNISDILSSRIEEMLKFFENIPRIKEKLQTLYDVGLGYIELGQSATTLSGGEAQRVKLATELSRRSTGRTLYILDEPTTGLHFADIKKLLDVLNRLIKGGNTVIVIEHNPDVIKTADYIIDLGPEGGDEGGYVVAQGTPEQIASHKSSYTGHFLKKLL